MRVFRDLNFVEQLGTGIQRVLKTYDKNIFEFFPNHIRVTIPFNVNSFNYAKEKIENMDLNNLQNNILKIINDKPNVTQEELALILDVNKRTIIRNFKRLVEENYITRIGANKNGYWKIIKK